METSTDNRRNYWAGAIIVLLIALSVICLIAYQQSIQPELVKTYTNTSSVQLLMERIESPEAEGGKIAEPEDLLYTMRKTGLFDDQRLTQESALKILFTLNPRKDNIYHVGEEIKLPVTQEKWWPLP
jgi:hypothetical protein